MIVNEPYPQLFDPKEIKRMGKETRANLEIQRLEILAARNPNKEFTHEQRNMYIYWLEEHRRIPRPTPVGKYLLVFFVGYILGILYMSRPQTYQVQDTSGDSGYEAPFGKP